MNVSDKPDGKPLVLGTQASSPARLLFKLFGVFSIAGVTILMFAVSVSAQKMKVPENADYKVFQHTTAYHARLPCSLCHKRENNSTRPQFPGGSKHLPCAGCHAKQFADSSSPICTICHNNPSAGSLKSFPSLKSFNMTFDHASHTSGGRSGCVTCHSPSRGGVAFTIPSGAGAHATCFQCHGPQAKSGERDISSCNLCHQPGQLARVSQNALAFRNGFSHNKHNADEGLSCNQCHRVRAGAKDDVTAPQPLNHHASGTSFSCASCHNGKKAFGGDDFSVCKRCHKGEAWRF